MTWGTWRRTGTSTHAETCPHLPVALRSRPQQPRPAVASLSHSSGASLNFCIPSLNKGLRDACPAGWATKALGIRGNKSRGKAECWRAISRRAIKSRPTEEVAPDGDPDCAAGAGWVRTWGVPLALPVLPLQRHSQEGASFPALWSEAPRMAEEDGELQGRQPYTYMAVTCLALAIMDGRGHGTARNGRLLGHRKKVWGQKLGNAYSEVQNGKIHHRVYMPRSLGP